MSKEGSDMRTARLTDEERGARVREQGQRTSERRRQRLRQSGYIQTVFWLPSELRRQIDRIAAERSEPISTVAERLLSAALVMPTATQPTPAATATPASESTDTEESTAGTPPSVSVEKEAPATRAERDRRILELHRQGVSGREIARRVGCGETTVRKILKQVAAAATG